jgi:enoyl-[acyl-carrier-protein] reductase (NADH)
VHYLKREDEAEQTARVVEQLGARAVLIEHFYRPALDLTPAHWRNAMDSQATALLLSAREAATMMVENGGRIVAVTYASGGRTGSWRSWAAMGPAKAAMESLRDISPRNWPDAVSPSTR